MEKYIHHKSKITVAVNDLDFKQHIKPGAVMRYFQDAATEHAIILGYSYDDMIKLNLLWVILRMSIKIDIQPKLGETLSILTFPEKPSASSVDRSYYAYSENGDLIMSGSSKWCVIDAHTHRIKRCAPLFDGIDPGSFIEQQPFEGVNPKLEKQTQSGSGDKVYTGTVRITDLDRNIHMNNACYGDIVLNACGIEMLETKHISLMHVNFLSELFYNDTFDVYRIDKDGITYAEAVKAPAHDDKPDNRPDIVFRALAQWSEDKR